MKFDGGGSERIKKSESALMLSLLLSNVAESLILWVLPLLYFDDMSDILDVEFHRFNTGAEVAAVFGPWLLCALPCLLETGGMVLYMALLFHLSVALVTTVTSRSI
jgi:hypothetical protein